MPLLPRKTGPRQIDEVDFSSASLAVNEDLIFEFATPNFFYKAPRLEGLLLTNSTARDAYFQCVFAIDKTSAATLPNGGGLSIRPFLVPAKSSLFLKDEAWVITNKVFQFNHSLFALVSETHFQYTPFKRLADGEITGTTVVRV